MFKRIAIVAAVSAVLVNPWPLFADDAVDLEEMQKALNEQVMTKPFSVEEEAKINQYIEESTKNNRVPQEYTGTYWRPGYTCRDLRPFSYSEYRACRYYYHYYGRYYLVIP